MGDFNSNSLKGHLVGRARVSVGSKALHYTTPLIWGGRRAQTSGKLLNARQEGGIRERRKDSAHSTQP